MGNSKSFTHLHVHNEYSMLDGAAKIDDALDTVAKFGQPALATTNHGYQYDAYEFYQKATARGINPIIGVEAYLAPTSRLHKKPSPLQGVEETKTPYTHLTLLSENNQGLRNLFTLSSRASIEGYFYKPRMDRELLAQYGKGIIATSGCLGSEVNQLLLAGRYDLALQSAGELQDIFGKENFFFEIMSHGIEDESRIFPEQLKIAQHIGAPLVATNDSHYTTPDQEHAHDALLCIQTGATFSSEKRFKFEGHGYHIKSTEEMRELWKDFPEACDNTLLIAERCRVQFEARDDLFPHFPIPAGFTEETYLAEQTWAGIKERYGENPTPEVIERTQYELGIINSKGFAGYFLVVSDFVRWAKSHGIKVGPGRGSAAGSIVAYATHCTELDPIMHKLMFERFLNPERNSMPDMDIDFDDNRRGEVIEYVRQKYGSDKVAQIVTYSTIKAKQAIKDAARVLDKPIQLGDKLSKLMPEPSKGKSPDLSVIVDKHDPRYKEASDIRNEMSANQDAREVIDLALGLEGLKRQVGLHAAGVIISGKPLIDVIPVSLDEKTGSLVTQFDYPTCESLGLLKMDFLGLKNLSIIDKALSNIEHTTGEKVNLEALPLDDKKTYELFASGNTLGVFQVDSEGMQKLLRRMKPTVFNDISAVLALYRPGPMGIGAHNQYADRKNGREAVDYIHPDLAQAIGPILEDTYGLCIFQEQVMQIAQTLAGYSLGEADLLRKAMGKKKPEVLAELEPEFRNRVVANGYSNESFDALWGVLLPFADYAFNRAHTASYGLISYWTGWLKAHHPAEYMAALLDSASPDSLPLYLAEAERMGIEILPPDVNSSLYSYTPQQGMKIRYGLGKIRNVGAIPSTVIVHEREKGGAFASLTDFLTRTGITSQVASSLAQAGALDAFSNSRSGMFEALPSLLPVAQARFREATLGNVDLFSMLQNETGEPLSDPDFGEETWSNSTKLQKEFLMTGMYLSGSPLEGYQQAIRRYSHIKSPSDLQAFKSGDSIIIGGILKSVERRIAKKSGRPWIQTNILFDAGTLSARAFGKIAANDSPKIGLFEEDNIVLLKCKLEQEEDSGEYSLLIQDIVACKKDEKLAPMKELLISPPLSGFTLPSFEKFKQVSPRYPGGYNLYIKSPSTGLIVNTGVAGDGSSRMKIAFQKIFGRETTFELFNT